MVSYFFYNVSCDSLLSKRHSHYNTRNFAIFSMPGCRLEVCYKTFLPGTIPKWWNDLNIIKRKAIPFTLFKKNIRNNITFPPVRLFTLMIPNDNHWGSSKCHWGLYSLGIITAKIRCHWWVNINRSLVGVNCSWSTWTFLYQWDSFLYHLEN